MSEVVKKVVLWVSEQETDGQNVLCDLHEDVLCEENLIEVE